MLFPCLGGEQFDSYAKNMLKICYISSIYMLYAIYSYCWDVFVSNTIHLVRMICVKFRVNRSLFIRGLKLGRLIQFGSLNIFRVGAIAKMTQIQDGRQFTILNVQTCLVWGPNKVQKHRRCHFQLYQGCRLICQNQISPQIQHGCQLCPQVQCGCVCLSNVQTCLVWVPNRKTLKM